MFYYSLSTHSLYFVLLFLTVLIFITLLINLMTLICVLMLCFMLLYILCVLCVFFTKVTFMLLACACQNYVKFFSQFPKNRFLLRSKECNATRSLNHITFQITTNYISSILMCLPIIVTLQ